MRRNCILLLLVAVVSAVCGAVSAISSDQTKSALATGSGAALEENNLGRLLRSLEKVEDDVADEERGFLSGLKKVLGIKGKNPDFAKKNLKMALKDQNSRNELYKKWEGYSVGEIKANLKHTDMYHPREHTLFYGYLNKYKKAAETVKQPAVAQGKAKKSVKFKLDEVQVRRFDDEGNKIDEIVRLDGAA
ncbi:avirulence protein 1b [Phytophthora sojae]|uniref:RxLR effector protein n=2 Tax=Phytophthora sojae TaxID=67593 RepID=G4ZW00_PHYSP|nr:avirulence protein 1b [Phytophthora sojae]AEK80478.1 Avh15 [Phytophthora sojae]EGZ11580.1 avirulence protein 1b [Phytophthora sojae]|eukprot:XP_009531913.1 avirulence protein 1b [Phytophthora sojae]